MKNILLFQPVQDLQAARRDLRVLIALAAHAVIQRCDDAKIDVHGLKIADAAAGNVQRQCADGRLLREIDRRQAEQLRGRLDADERAGRARLHIALNTGHLPGEADARVAPETIIPVEQLRRI